MLSPAPQVQKHMDKHFSVTMHGRAEPPDIQKGVQKRNVMRMFIMLNNDWPKVLTSKIHTKFSVVLDGWA